MFKLSLAFAAVTFVVGQNRAAYCDLLTAQCAATLPSGFNSSSCLAAVTNISLGTTGSVGTSDIACRIKFLDDVAYNTSANKCQYASISGGGQCGEPLTALCNVVDTVCGAVIGSSFATNECTAGLGAITSVWGTKQGASADGENSLECRLYHTLVGLNVASHCGHISANSTQCGGRVAPSLSHYCDTLQNNCVGNSSQFSSKAQCMTTAASFANNATTDIGSQGLNTEHTLGCREYHAQVALGSPISHCPHAGPSGGNACGSPREAWASIAKAAPCNNVQVDTFASLFKANQAGANFIDRLIPAGPLTGAYSTAWDISGNTQACRIYHLAVASESASLALAHCKHGGLTGGGACGSTVDNLCHLISEVCTFGSNASWQFANLSDCTTGLATLAEGSSAPWDTQNNTYQCRFYHTAVAASLTAGGVSAGTNATTDAAALIQKKYHCSHVLKTAAVNGCGYVASAPSMAAPSAPTNKAPSNKSPTAAKPSAASEVSAFVSMAVVIVSILAL